MAQKQPGYSRRDREARRSATSPAQQLRAPRRASRAASATARCAPPTRRTSCSAGCRRPPRRGSTARSGSSASPRPTPEHITDVVACPGGDYCTLAITRSMKLGADIRDAPRPRGHARRGRRHGAAPSAPSTIKISGCPNSCGQHHVADIGMTGLMVKGADGVERPHYSLRVGGGVRPRRAHRRPARRPRARGGDAARSSPRSRGTTSSARRGRDVPEFAARVGAAELTSVGFAGLESVI